MRVYVLEFAGLPPNPNARLHYLAKARATKHWRRQAYLLARMAEIPWLGRIRVSAVFTRRALGTADPSNDLARLKPIEDGLVDAGILDKDTYGRIEWAPPREEPGRPGVKLTIEPLED